LAHPGLDPVSERHAQPPRIQARERAKLHRDKTRITERRRKQPDPNADPVDRRQDRCCRRDPAVSETVLDQPKLVEPKQLNATRERREPVDRQAGRKHRTSTDGSDHAGRLREVSGREVLSVPVTGGALGGWVTGDGQPVLLLHGGPGLSYEYLNELRVELGSGYRIASYQQRGLEPSTLKGPFTVAQEIADALAVLDELGWSDALIVGHSWGGHLALRLAAAYPDRILGALAIDPLGVVGDGGQAAFEAEMAARTPKADRERAVELDRRAMAGEGSPEDLMESVRIVWPAYFADPENVPAMPPIRMSVEVYSSIVADLTTDIDKVTAALATGAVAYGVLAGAASPMPWGQAARATAELSPRGFLTVVPAAGHFPWFEAPGRVRAALARLHE